jgi:hypothetical protein
VTRLDEEDEDEWNRTLRPNVTLEPPPGTRSAAHSRESSIEKVSSPPTISPRLAQPGQSRTAGLGSVLERAVDKGSSYGHHRQTSIVHGIQHSRNGSLASSSSSPLSPQMIAAVGAALISDRPDIHVVARGEGDPTLSRPQTALSGTTVTSMPQMPDRTTPAAVADTSTYSATTRKLERMHSGRRRDHNHHHSHSSRHSKDEQKKSVLDYSMHVLFTAFIAQAEEKLNQCTAVPFDPEPNVEQICGPGADPGFDQSIIALAYLARDKPKPLIDLMMYWRKSKSDAAGEARSLLHQGKGGVVPGLQRRNTEPVQSPPAQPSQETGQGQLPAGLTTVAARQEFVAQQERRSTVSIYILCRILLETISHSSLACITAEMEEKLEGIIFGQLKIADTESLMMSSLKLANWNLFTQILGVMSEINFTSVTKRFISDLEISLQDLVIKSPNSAAGREMEGKMELVLGGMKHLRIKLVPLECWEQSCDFLIGLGRLFHKSHGPKVKSAFCQMLDMLLLPIAAKATNADLAHPKWGEVRGVISPRLAQMLMKPRHWSFAFPLTATLLCVSTPDTFSSQWLQLILPLHAKFKDRFAKSLCLQVISRLVWTYLYRSSDTMANTIRKLDEVMKVALPPTKRSMIASDPAVAEPLIQIIRIIGFKHPEFCFKTIVFPLINAELFTFTSGDKLKVEQLDPDRIVIGIRAFLAIMSDLEKGDQGQPPFPQYYAPSSTDRMPTSPGITSPRNGPLASPLLHFSKEAEASSQPIRMNKLSDAVREYYLRFREILGQITIMCDNTFGGQAVLDEKFSSPGPKTPISDTFNFSRRDDHQNPSDQKQLFYELLHVAVQALPRCLSVDIPFNSLINLLCTGTAHVQPNIAESSAQSLKAISRQSHAQQVTMGFSRYIFNFDDRYATMSEGGMLGPGHIENTLRLYIELLQIWIEEIRQKIKDSGSTASGAPAGAPAGVAAEASVTSAAGGEKNRSLKLDLFSVWAEVENVEAHGLFFLCSQSLRVRHFAITVLRLITAFDTALGKSSGQATEKKDTPRLIDILENDSSEVLNFRDDSLSVAERSRLQRGIQSGNNKGTLIELCTSDVSYDTTLWFKIFPNLMRLAFEKCPITVTIGRDLICNRIIQMYKTIVNIADPKPGTYFGSDPGSARLGRTPTTHPDVLIEQWKLYLIFACTTLADPGNAPLTTPTTHQHHRKGSNKSNSAEKIVSARTLFKYLIPMLSATTAAVREAVVVGMGSINIHIYRTLLEELQSQVSQCNNEAKARIHQRSNSSPRRNRKMDLLRTEITNVYKLTSHFLKEPQVYQDEWILTNLVTYTKDLKLFLMDVEVLVDWEFQKLRRHYCGLMEELYEGINRTKDRSRWMTFESRKSAFSLMEDWCGFSPNQNQIRVREDAMRQSVIDQQRESEAGKVTAAMEIEKRNLRTAALSAMAALCGGPITLTTESGVVLQFDPRRLLAWIEAIFNSGSDRMNLIGRRALQNLIIHNKEHTYLLEHSIARCYLAEVPKVMESYFAVVTQVLLDHVDYPSPTWKVLGLCLFTLGNDESEIRSKAAHVLRTLDERQQQQSGRSSRVQDFDISISDKTKVVYKLAQFEISKRLSKQHTDLAFHVFSEFTLYFKDMHPASQRNVVAVILPWIQTIELKVDPNGGPTANSYVLLANLLEITIKASGALHNEVQALWQALATGPHPGNVRVILDFIISLCLERREQNFVEYAKQIVVFLSSTPGAKVVDFLLMQITPKAMVPNEKREILPPPPDVVLLPYCADLAEALPGGQKQAGLSLGQLSLILLVDLMVSPVQLTQEDVPVLLQVVTVLWDHYTPLVQEQAREMLVHLIHELVISALDEQTPTAARKSIEDLIDLIRRHDRAVVWGYEDSNGKVDDKDNVPPSMEYLAAEVVKTFEITFPGIKEQWGRLSLTWATSCPVRHLACRSFQIFRCVLTSLDQAMLGSMLVRLSNTIADEDPEIQTFSMEILTTLKTLIGKLDAEKLLGFPQLFWTTCACLESINEREFLEAVEMLNEYLVKVDFQSDKVRRMLLDGQPSRWDGQFDGLQPLLYKGLRSSLCIEPSVQLILKLVQLPSDALVGDDSRHFFAVLANLPSFLHCMEAGPNHQDEKVLQAAETLLAVAEAEGYTSLAPVLESFVSRKYRTGHEFLVDIFGAFREYFLPQLEFSMITFFMGMLTNSLPWVKLETMQILRTALPEVDMKKTEMWGYGCDLVSPLLRLLQTDYCMEALKVLDKCMGMPTAPNDRQHLRMSMIMNMSKSIRKEYERTQSLFGIPDPSGSGWAISMPAKKTDSTRASIHAAFYMCQSVEGGATTDATPTPDVEFHADDEFAYGYFPVPDRTETMISDDMRAESTTGDLVTKLDSLDDFFDDLSTGAPSEGRSSRTVTEYDPDNLTSSVQIYDDQILPILHQAQSTSSFQNGFSDNRPATATSQASQANNAMNPGAFTVVQSANRPPLHSRSVTSPSTPASSSHNTHLGDMTSDDEFGEDVFSDADDERPHTGGGEGSFFLENMIRPLTNSTRTGMRRLGTSGSSRKGDLERQRELFRAQPPPGPPAPPPQTMPKLPSGTNMFPPPKASSSQAQQPPGDML